MKPPTPLTQSSYLQSRYCPAPPHHNKQLSGFIPIGGEWGVMRGSVGEGVGLLGVGGREVVVPVVEEEEGDDGGDDGEVEGEAEQLQPPDHHRPLVLDVVLRQQRQQLVPGKPRLLLPSLPPVSDHGKARGRGERKRKKESHHLCSTVSTGYPLSR